MAFGIRLVHAGPLATTLPESERPQKGNWLAEFDPDSMDGVGLALWTADPAEAMRFATIAEAAELWRTQSKVKPLREDGKPNRPLSAYSVTIMDLP